MFKKFSLLLITALFISIPFTGIFGQAVEEIHFLEDRRCPDCAKQKEFMEGDLREKYPDLEVYHYSITNEEERREFDRLVREDRELDYRLMTPTTVIGQNLFQGFFEDDTYLIKRAVEGEYVQREIDEVRGVIRIPFTNFRIRVDDLSLPVLAVVLGSLDGLNVCSIGALILILMIVLNFDSRKKIVFFGGLFILTAVIIYGVLVFAWTALFEVLASYIGPINIVIGIAALFGALFFLKEFIRFLKHGPTCESSGSKLATKATERLKSAFESEGSRTAALIGSVVIFAAVITLVELPCSFVLPMIFGGALAEAGLSGSAYAFYIIFYLLFYMLIELVIFAGAVITKEIWIAESKMITWIYLLGTLVLFFLSYYYLIGL